MKNTWEISIDKFEFDPNIKKFLSTDWIGHRYFAYDLVNFAEPECIVELGTYSGCSLFSFCSSVLDNGLNTKVIAVDTWSGDENIGFYEDEIYMIVEHIKQTYFSAVDLELKRMTFDQALADVTDETIDILHIDGFHSYEAVSHDFFTWLPKLKQNGVVLFHDTAPKYNYGSYHFWEELKALGHKHLEFIHCNGLGILFPKGEAVYNKLTELDIENKLEKYKHKGVIEDLEMAYDIDKDKIMEDYKRRIESFAEIIDSYEQLVKKLQRKIMLQDLLLKANKN